MHVIIGKVKDGKVVLEGAKLEEGAEVIVLIREAEETFELSPEDESRLLEAIGEADRGELVDAEDVLRRIEPKS